MLHISPWKTVAIVAVTLLSLIYTLPNFLPAGSLDGFPSWWPKKPFALGLDLQGGSHLLLQADLESRDEVDKATGQKKHVKGLKEEWRDQIEADIRKRLRDAKIGYSGLGVSGESVKVRITKPEDLDRAKTELAGMAQPLTGGMVSGITGTAAKDLEIVAAADGTITITPTPQALTARVNNGMSSLISVLGQRINALGTTEPTIIRQGADRIVVQVPGLENPELLKELIGKTAKLSFHEVDQSKTVADAEATGVPPGSSIFPMVRDGGDANAPQSKILIKTAAVVSGEDLVDSQPSFDGQTHEPVVSFRFNTSGARRFGKYTQENVGRPFAIVLDDTVISAPVIRDAILGGSGQISGNFSVQEANSLSIQLRSGALPVSLKVVEERSVGPSLGRDSISQGLVAGVIGSLGTAALTMLIYGLFGAFATIGLILHGLLVAAIMSGMQATLTLPGIAGIVLTIGMGVDANVLIYERIKEELRSGKSPISAIEAGFNRAMVTIADSQLTALAAALVMFWLGSGPIRGFAVTLSIGVVTSVFTAVTAVRLIISLWLRRARAKQRHIEVPV
ncbi:MAG: protein translocase subunit SecD [Hyphomicrobiaceae bacterium]